MSVRAEILTALADSFKAAVAGADYGGAIVDAERWAKNINEIPKDKMPFVAIIDNGKETKLVEDATHIRWSLGIEFWSVVSAEDKDESLDKINDVIADVKKFCSSNPALHTNVLAVQLGDVSTVAIGDSKIAFCIVGASIIYACEKGTF